MQNIYIKDFSILEQTLNAILKIVPSVKFIINETGLTIHSCNAYARCSVFTNSVTSDEELNLCIKDVNTLAKTLSIIKDEEGKKKTESNAVINATYDGTFIYLNTKNIKTKIITVKEEVISNTISKAVTTVLTPVLEFKTSSENIKKVLSNSFMFNDVENVRVYLNQHDDLQQNCLYAEVTNKTNRLSNNITVKLGDITLGKVTEDIILDFERLSVFNLFKNDNIVIQLMDKPFLVAELSIFKDNIFSKFTIYNSLRKS